MYIEKDSKAECTKLIKDLSDDVFFYQDYYGRHNRFPMFTQVLIETRTDCNQKCSFCPQAYSERRFDEMKWDVYKEIIEQLVILNFTGRLALFVYNEPLLDPRLCEFISYARKRSGRFFIDLNTNGKLLTSSLLDDLFRAGLDIINLDDYRSDRQKFPDRISNNLQKILLDFRYTPKITLHKRSSNEYLSTCSGIVPQKKEIRQYGFCNFPFRKLVVSPNGDIIKCCNDYHYATSMGNVMTDSLNDLWSSSTMDKLRWDLIKGNRFGICEKCDQVQNYNTQKYDE